MVRLTYGIPVFAAALCAAGCEALPPAARSSCPPGGGTLAAVTDAEYAFSRAAETSVRGAFLQVLADDAVVLQPEPRPGRALYEAAPESADRLAWYPAIADVATSADLGFTTGPWVYTIAANGKQLHGSYVTVWRRTSTCQWQVVLDGGVSHALSAPPEPELHPDPRIRATAHRPHPGSEASFAAAMRAFHEAAQGGGLGEALPQFAAKDFRAYADGQLPFDEAAPAAQYFKTHPAKGHWRESRHQLSTDGSLAYAYGELSDAAVDADPSRTGAYVEVWRYDEGGGRWRVRLLLLLAYPPPTPKS